MLVLQETPFYTRFMTQRSLALLTDDLDKPTDAKHSHASKAASMTGSGDVLEAITILDQRVKLFQSDIQ